MRDQENITQPKTSSEESEREEQGQHAVLNISCALNDASVSVLKKKNEKEDV